MKDIYENIDKILLDKEVLSKEKIETAKKEADKRGVTVYESLRDMGLVSEKKMAGLVAEELNLPLVELSDYIMDNDVIKSIPEKAAREYQVIPIFKIGDSLTVAMANPTDIEAIDEIKLRSGCDVIEPVVAVSEEINQAINTHYKATEKVNEVIESITRIEEPSERVEERDLIEMAEEAPIVKLVNLIIAEAVENGVSDIHIEPDEKILRVRYRIDGVLHEVNKTPKHLQSAVISRIKILAGMDIAKKRIPQDGRINLKIKNKELDLRISTFPTIHGENVVMRILDKSSVLKGLEKLGFSKEDLSKFNSLIRQPDGIILVTGPTGSGKTTTLYSALSAINSLEKNIITIEDPVEYRLPFIRQTQVNPKAGIDFANGLRSILRQDPDIIMVGEVRDKDTVEIAIQAALTGHLVFTTLHTNDAPGALTRLIDMGAEPFLISSSVTAILAQRLVRLICPKCKEKIKLSEKKLKDLGFKKSDSVYKGSGCKKCRNTGYIGRTGIFELLNIDDDIRELIVEKVTTTKIKKVTVGKGMNTLIADGLEKVKQGLTSLEEVLRVT